MSRESRARPDGSASWPRSSSALLAGCGDAPPAGLKVEDLTVASRAVSAGTWPLRSSCPKAAPPAGHCSCSCTAAAATSGSYLRDPLFEAIAALKDRAPVVAFPDGDEDKYWHDRDERRLGPLRDRRGDPAGRASEFGTDRRPRRDRRDLDGRLRRLRHRRASTRGASARSAGTRRRCGAAAARPRRARSTTPRTSPRHDVIAEANALDRLPVWLDAGDEDPFQPGRRGVRRRRSRSSAPTRPSTPGRAATTATTGTRTGATTCASTRASCGRC